MACAEFNREQLDNLHPDLPIAFYQSRDTGKPNIKHSVSRHLAFKPGAPVMLRTNLTDSLINGKIGTVSQCLANSVKVEFEGKVVEINPHMFEVYNAKSKKTLATRTQIPLTLAWAVTIHKAQGLTLDNITVHSKGIHKAGQLAVAISRVRSPNHVRLIGYRKSQAPQQLPCVSQYYGFPTLPLMPNLQCCRYRPNMATPVELEHCVTDSDPLDSESTGDGVSDDDDDNDENQDKHDDDDDDDDDDGDDGDDGDAEEHDDVEQGIEQFQHITQLMETEENNRKKELQYLCSPPANLIQVKIKFAEYKHNAHFLTFMQHTYLQIQVKFMPFLVQGFLERTFWK